jgi:hypothetical protein
MLKEEIQPGEGDGGGDHLLGRDVIHPTSHTYAKMALHLPQRRRPGREAQRTAAINTAAAEGPTTGAGRHAASAGTESTVPTGRYRSTDPMIQVKRNENCDFLFNLSRRKPVVYILKIFGQFYQIMFKIFFCTVVISVKNSRLILYALSTL